MSADLNLEEIIKACIKNDQVAQRTLFDRYAGKMMSVCRRYAKNQEEAEDFVQEGFIKMFKNLHQFKFEGSFDGWVRRIFVNTAIKHYHQQNKHHQTLDLLQGMNKTVDPNAISRLNENELMNLISELPAGYRVVFNMFVIEGYSHKEISEMLNIRESTSRSQLVKARKWLQSKIEIAEKVTI